MTETRTPANSFSDRLSITYDLNERHNIGTNLRYSQRKSTPRYSSFSDLFDSGVNASRSGSINNGEILNTQYQASLIYTWQLDKNGSSFEFTGDYLRYETDTERNYQYLYNIDQNDQYSRYSRSFIDDKVDMYYANAVFDINAGEKSRFGFGVNYDNNRTRQLLDYQDLDDDIWIPNDNRNDNYKLAGDNYNGFVSFSSEIGPKINYGLNAIYIPL